MKNAIKIAAMLILLTAIPAGCWGYREVDESAFILALGVDKGEKELLKLTAMIAVPKNIGGGGGQEGGGAVGGGGNSAMIVSVETPTILGGLDMMSSFVERRPTLKHTKGIVFSTELAREDMGRYLAPLVRFREFRRNTFIAVCRGPAKTFIENNRPIMEDNPAKFIELLVGTNAYTGFIPKSQVHYFYNAAKSEAEQPVALLAAVGGKNKEGQTEDEYLAGNIPREGGNKIELMGAAVFNGGRMVGVINGQETIIWQMINGMYQESIFSLPDPNVPGRYILLGVRAERKPDVEVVARTEVPEINIYVPLEAEFISIQSNIFYEHPKAIVEIENILEEMLGERAYELVTKTQEELAADIFGFGKIARQGFLTWDEWEQYNWLRVYPRSKVNIDFEVNIRRIGLMRESLPVREK